MKDFSRVRALEALSHDKKIRHWAGSDPWMIHGTRLHLPRNLPAIRNSRISIDHGNISRMPILIGRPCFGQPTAYLRHWSKPGYMDWKRGVYRPFRCSACGVRDACKYVAENRLTASQRIAVARREFEDAGGAGVLNLPDSFGSMTSRKWRDLTKELIDHGPFTSVNDDWLKKHYEDIANKQAEKERLRKKRQRAKVRLEKSKQGELPDEVANELIQVAKEYAAYHAVAKLHPEAPHFLRKCRRESAFYDADVFVSKQLLELSGANVNPSSIARQLHRRNLYIDRPINNLRQTVSFSLRRVARLQRTTLPGELEPIFPKLNLRKLIKEID